MKIDRFVKVMLVLIAVLLALNCAKDPNGRSVEAAAPPSFLQVGKSYMFKDYLMAPVEVLEIQNTGWVKVKRDSGVEWVNTNACISITPQ
jgi:hypothetical protein